MDFDSDDSAIVRAVDRQAKLYGMSAEDWIVRAWDLVIDRDADLAAKDRKERKNCLSAVEQREHFLTGLTGSTGSTGSGRG